MKKWFVKRRVVSERWVQVEAKTRNEAKQLAVEKIFAGECNSNGDEVTVSAQITN